MKETCARAQTRHYVLYGHLLMQKLHEHADLLTTTHEMNKAKVSVHMTVTSYSIHIYINVFYVVQHEGMCGLRVYTYFCLN